MSGYNYGYHEPTAKCPYCGTRCTADFVDVGVGMIQCGPYHCGRCFASEIGPYDNTFNPFRSILRNREKSPDAQVKNFIADVKNDPSVEPGEVEEAYRYYGTPLAIRYKNVHIILDATKNKAEIVDIRSDNPKSGDGTKAMKWLADMADRHGTKLTLTPDPYNENSMSADQLKDWYGKFGFKEGNGSELTRIPRKDAPAPLKVQNPEDRVLTQRESDTGWYEPETPPGSSANVIGGRVVSHTQMRDTYRDEFLGNPLWEDKAYVEDWWEEIRKKDD